MALGIAFTSHGSKFDSIENTKEHFSSPSSGSSVSVPKDSCSLGQSMFSAYEFSAFIM